MQDVKELVFIASILVVILLIVVIGVCLSALYGVNIHDNIVNYYIAIYG